MTEVSPSDLFGGPALLIWLCIIWTTLKAPGPRTPPSCCTLAAARLAHTLTGNASTTTWACVQHGQALSHHRCTLGPRVLHPGSRSAHTQFDRQHQHHKMGLRITSAGLAPLQDRHHAQLDLNRCTLQTAVASLPNLHLDRRPIRRHPVTSRYMKDQEHASQKAGGTCLQLSPPFVQEVQVECKSKGAPCIWMTARRKQEGSIVTAWPACLTTSTTWGKRAWHDHGEGVALPGMQGAAISGQGRP